MKMEKSIDFQIVDQNRRIQAQNIRNWNRKTVEWNVVKRYDICVQQE